MKRTGVVGLIVSLAVLLSIPASAHSQNRVSGSQKNTLRGNRQPLSTPSSKREFAPQIIGRANSFIITGRIVARRGPQLSVETTGGARLDFQVDGQTTLLESNELVSIATMDDITLRLADLRVSDEVEVVAEREGSRRLARIVTRTASGQPVARR
jgi:hypothetical protein